DIGDNGGRYPYIRIHLLEEPVYRGRSITVDTIPQGRLHSYVLTYEDGPRDAESLFFDPLDEQLYIISKRELEVGVYCTRIPEVPADTLTLRKVATLPLTFATSAAISPDGMELLVKNLLG